MSNQYTCRFVLQKGIEVKICAPDIDSMTVMRHSCHGFAKRRGMTWCRQGKRLATQMDEMCELLPKMIALRQHHGRKSSI